jgi:hypothetical protein
MRVDDLERLTPNRSGGAQQRNSFHPGSVGPPDPATVSSVLHPGQYRRIARVKGEGRLRLPPLRKGASCLRQAHCSQVRRVSSLLRFRVPHMGGVRQANDSTDAHRTDGVKSHRRRSRVRPGITSHVRVATISALRKSVRTGSGQCAIVGPSRASVKVMIAYAPVQVTSASLYFGGAVEGGPFGPSNTSPIVPADTSPAASIGLA